MSQAHFIILNAAFKDAVDDDKLTKVLDKGLDWVRIMPGCWLIWTTSSADRWYSRLREFSRPGNRISIFAVDAEDRSGFLPKSIWAFIRSKTDETSDKA